jgi:hypothetical protein
MLISGRESVSDPRGGIRVGSAFRKSSEVSSASEKSAREVMSEEVENTSRSL